MKTELELAELHAAAPRRALAGLCLCFDCSNERPLGVLRCPSCHRCTGCGLKSCSSVLCAAEAHEEGAAYQRWIATVGPHLPVKVREAADEIRRAG